MLISNYKRSARLAAKTIGFALAVLTTPGNARGDTPAPPVQALLTSLSTVSLLDQAQVVFTAAVARQRKAKTINGAEANQLLSLSRRIYVGSNLYPVFKRAYAKYSSYHDVTAVLSWLSSTPGLKFRASSATALQASDKTTKAYFDAHQAEVLRPNRKNALNSLAKAWQQNDLYVTYHRGMDFAVLLAFRGRSPLRAGEAEESPAQLKERLRKTKGELDRDAEEYYRVFDFYLCKEMKNEEIDDLSRFASSPAAIGHTKAYHRALDSTLESAALTLQAQLLKNDSKADAPPGKP